MQVWGKDHTCSHENHNFEHLEFFDQRFCQNFSIIPPYIEESEPKSKAKTIKTIFILIKQLWYEIFSKLELFNFIQQLTKAHTKKYLN